MTDDVVRRQEVGFEEARRVRISSVGSGRHATCHTFVEALEGMYTARKPAGVSVGIQFSLAGLL